jgi:hypothetical protein
VSEITEIKNVWTVLIPEVPAPTDRQWSLWVILHDPEIVRKGIGQLAAKYRKLGGQMDTDYMVRFASSVMNRLSRERATGAGAEQLAGPRIVADAN